MKKYVTLFLLLVPFLFLAQKGGFIKRKCLGEYSGVIPAYKIQTDDTLLNVGESSFYLELKKKEVNVKIGNKVQTGVYKILYKTKRFYAIEVRLNEQPYPERFFVYIKDKKVIREGLYPQPEAELNKL